MTDRLEHEVRTMTFDEWLGKDGPLLAALGVTPIEKRQMETAWNAGAEAERNAIIALIPVGSIVDPQKICDMIRERSSRE